MKLILIVLWLVVLAPTAHAGFDSGNAGDAYSAEFLYSGRDVLQRLELMASNGKTLLDTKKLRQAMEAATIVSEEKVYLNGMERDAVNFPSQKLIKVSRSRWKELRQTNETRARLTLVLHEFLWLSGVDDTNFVRSDSIIRALNVAPYSPSIWLNVPGLAFASVECAGLSKEGTFVKVVVQTKGVTKAPDRGEVIIEKDGNKFGYRFGAEEISQFFEFDDVETNAAMVGLGAYVGREFPLSVKYAGPNYVDMDLRAVIDTGGNMPAGTSNSRNFMLIWKGHGHPAEAQHKIENPVCSVSSNN